MKIKSKKLYSRLYKPSLIALTFIFILLFYRLLISENQCFLYINKFHNTFADYFFAIITNVGDGLIWLPLLLFIFRFRKKSVFLVLANFLVSSIITLFIKRILFWDALSPISLIAKNYHLHLIEGIQIHTNNSFPSGHTVTIFAVVFTLITFYKKNFFLKYILLLTAFIVGFSRVYLAQHFPIDVLAGALIGILSTYISIFMLSRFNTFKYAVIEDDREQLEMLGI
jgi:membrane-associated phospholipid phosphatase